MSGLSSYFLIKSWLMWALLNLEKYKTTNYDISGMRRFSWNIFQWKKNDMKSTKMTNSDY